VGRVRGHNAHAIYYLPVIPTGAADQDRDNQRRLAVTIGRFEMELRPITGCLPPPIPQNIWNQRFSAISAQHAEPVEVTGKVFLTKNLAGMAARGGDLSLGRVLHSRIVEGRKKCRAAKL
jgi:hypothetical protein